MTVRAAGGVVSRRREDGRVEVLLVHRPRYDDWTLPKGKCRGEEQDSECALREVEEETGLRCELLESLPSTRYRDAGGRDKLVRYWRMRPVDGAFEPGPEVDAVAWVAPDEAERKLTYERERPVLRAAL